MFSIQVVLCDSDRRHDFRNFLDEARRNTVHFELLHFAQAGYSERSTQIGVAIEEKDGVGERFGILGLYQKSAASDYFRYSRCAHSDNRLSSSHGLEKYNAEAFLGARQAKKVTPIVFG